MMIRYINNIRIESIVVRSIWIMGVRLTFRRQKQYSINENQLFFLKLRKFGNSRDQNLHFSDNLPKLG